MQKDNTPTESESNDDSDYDQKRRTKQTSKNQTNSKNSTKENGPKRVMPPRAAKNNQAKMKNQTNITVGITKSLIIKSVFPDDSDVETLFHKLARENQQEFYDELGVNEGDRNEETKQETSKGKFSECKICSNKKISLNNKLTHDLVHTNSSFISDLMKKYFGEFPADNTKICCSKCNRNQLISLFNKMETLKHLSLQHIDEFKGKEKEILKQIGFFAIVKKKQPQFFNEAIKTFEFSHDQMVDFLKLYFSNEKKDHTKRDLLLGKMFLQLKNISGKELEDEFTKGIIADLIRNYQKILENEKKMVTHAESQMDQTQNDDEVEEDKCQSELSYPDSLNKRSANYDISKHDTLRKKTKTGNEVQEVDQDPPIDFSEIKSKVNSILITNLVIAIEKRKNQDSMSDSESTSKISDVESVKNFDQLPVFNQLETFKNSTGELYAQNKLSENRVARYKHKLKIAKNKIEELKNTIKELKKSLNEK